MGLPHLEHGRIPISARLNIGLGWTDDMMLPSVGREHAALSVTDNCRYGAVMAPAYLNPVRTPWSILLSLKETLASPAPLLNAHATLKHEISIGQR
jgi:hypothetical protein